MLVRAWASSLAQWITHPPLRPPLRARRSRSADKMSFPSRAEFGKSKKSCFKVIIWEYFCETYFILNRDSFQVWFWDQWRGDNFHVLTCIHSQTFFWFDYYVLSVVTTIIISITIFNGQSYGPVLTNEWYMWGEATHLCGCCSPLMVLYWSLIISVSSLSWSAFG